MFNKWTKWLEKRRKYKRKLLIHKMAFHLYRKDYKKYIKKCVNSSDKYFLIEPKFEDYFNQQQPVESYPSAQHFFDDDINCKLSNCQTNVDCLSGICVSSCQTNVDCISDYSCVNYSPWSKIENKKNIFKLKDDLFKL